MLRSFLIFLLSVGLILVICLPAVWWILPKSSLPQSSSSTSSSRIHPTEQQPPSSTSLPSQSASSPDESSLPMMTFSLYDEGTGERLTLSARDYVRGALASEMPPTFHPEALKAQAVACHTYAMYVALVERNANTKDASLHGADFKVDTVKREGYVTEEIAKSRYGEENADAWWQIICDAADAVYDEILTYEAEPIVAVYHAISPGVTERASAVWLTDLPYLVPVVSDGDLIAPGYESTVTFTQKQVKNKLTTIGANSFSKDPSEWFSDFSRSESGTILSVDAAGTVTDGPSLRTLFGLRSACFEIDYDAESSSFTFTCHGYGHGVGLSQYGAEGLAQEGKTYKEILAHYYPDTALTKVVDAS